MESNPYQRLAARLLDLGMITQERAIALTEFADWGSPDKPVRDADLHGVLTMCGVAIRVHGDDVDSAEEAYELLLQEAAALSGGSVTVSDIRLLPADDEKELHSLVNGKPSTWQIEQESDDYLDLTAVWTGINDLAPSNDPRTFHPTRAKPPTWDDLHLLATPEHARALQDEFDLGIRVQEPAN